MNININISGLSESKSTQLLTNVINCMQSEIEKYSTLEGEKKVLETKCSTLEGEKKELETKCSTLEDEKKELETKYSTLEGEKKELETKYSTLEGEKKELETKYSTLEGEKKELETKYSTLEGEKKELETKYSTLEGEKKELETKYSTLEGEKKELETKYSTLEGEKKVSDNQINEFERGNTDRFVTSIKQVSKALNSSLKSELNSEWSEYIDRIKTDIDVFLSEVKSINDITFKIVSKNGWFAKLASIYWWSVSSKVRAYLPISLQEESGFYYSFCNLLNELKLSGIDVTIPKGDFSNKIDSYKKDYSDETAVQKLFPEYRPESFVLCEINYVSFNGNLGTCIGYK